MREAQFLFAFSVSAYREVYLNSINSQVHNPYLEADTI